MSAQCAVGVAEMKRSPVVRGARGSERPENCPVDSFQWRTGGSPGKGVATIEIAESAPTEIADTML